MEIISPASQRAYSIATYVTETNLAFKPMTRLEDREAGEGQDHKEGHPAQ